MRFSVHLALITLMLTFLATNCVTGSFESEPLLKVDLMIVVNTDLPSTELRLVKQWIKDLVGNFNISDSAVRVGVIRYANSLRNLDASPIDNGSDIDLGQYENKSLLQMAVNENITALHNSSIDLHQALQKSEENFLMSERFADSWTFKILLLLENQDVDFSSVSLLNDLVDEEIILFVVGIGESTLRLLRFVGDSSIFFSLGDEMVYYLNDYNAILSNADQLASDIYILSDNCKNGTCLNGGNCSSSQTYCECPHSFIGRRCQYSPCNFRDDVCVKGTCDLMGEQLICLCRGNYSESECVATPCSDSPCVNGGICNPVPTDIGYGYTCSCRHGYSGYNCGQCSQCNNSISCEYSHSPPYYTCACKDGYDGIDCAEVAESKNVRLIILIVVMVLAAIVLPVTIFYYRSSLCRKNRPPNAVTEHVDKHIDVETPLNLSDNAKTDREQVANSHEDSSSKNPCQETLIGS